MKMNIKDLIMYINKKYEDFEDIRKTACNNQYTSESDSYEQVLSEKTNIIGECFDDMDNIVKEILKLHSLRNEINMNTYGEFKGEKYRLIDLITLIQIKQLQLAKIDHFISASYKQTIKYFSQNLGKTIYKEYNGDVKDLSERHKCLQEDIRQLQSIVDMLNSTTYLDI